MGWSGASVGEKIGTIAQTAVAAGKIAAPVYAAKKGVEYLTTSATEEVEKAQAERKKKREEKGQP